MSDMFVLYIKIVIQMNFRILISISIRNRLPLLLKSSNFILNFLQSHLLDVI